MKDRDKTKEQLIEELTALRSRVVELEKSQAKLKKPIKDLCMMDLAINSSINAIGIANMSGKVIYVNDSFVKMWGYERKKEILGRSFFSLWEGDGIQKTKKALREKGGSIGVDIGKRRDGSLFDAQFAVKVVKDESGHPLYMFGSFLDISGQKKAEEQILLANERLKYLLSSTSAVIYTSTVSGDYPATFISENVKQMTGYEPWRFLEKSSFWINHVHPDDRQRILAELTQIFEKDVYSYEYRFRVKNGTYIWVRDEMKLVRDKKGKPLEIIGYWIDITDRKKTEEELQKAHDLLEMKVTERTSELMKANVQMRKEIEERKRVEKALKESKEKLRGTLDSSPDAIAVTDMDVVIVDCNQAGLDMIGYSTKQELIGNRAFKLIAYEDRERAEKNMRETLKHGSLKNVEYTLLRKDGRKLPVELAASVIQDDTGKLAGFVAIIKDISERKKAEESLRKSEAKLKRQKLVLEQKNIALREIIAQIEVEKRKLKDDISANASSVLFPILEKLKDNKSAQEYIDLLRHHIEGLTSSFGSKITDKQTKLTPREIEICNMVKAGLSNKDISGLLHISCQTVEGHRKSIRQKLGISNKNVNLTSFLRNL